MDYLRINGDNLMETIPEASRDAQMEFIDAYRRTQADNTAQLGAAAHALGSDLPAQYGGLHGPSDYIKSRYQTPQTESRIAGLRSAAQLSALNNAMNNELNKWKNKYADAVNAANNKKASTTTDGGVLTDEIQEYTPVPQFEFSSEEYGPIEAPYGVTRTYGQGQFDGVPIVNDSANAAGGSLEGATLLSGNGSDFHIDNKMINQNAHSPIEFLWNNPFINTLIGANVY